MEKKIAYLSMEFGIEGQPVGGGLGILAGDFLKACADLGLPVVGIGLNFTKGNFRQRLLEDGWQEEWFDMHDPLGLTKFYPTNVKVQVMGRNVSLDTYRHDIVGENGNIVPLYLLSPNGENGERRIHESITDVLYPKDSSKRLSQEQILGIGGVRVLEELGYNIGKYHLNEGHAALAGLELLAKSEDIKKVREQLIFTTHTPVPSGHDIFTRQLAEQVLGKCLPSSGYMRSLTDDDNLNMTKLAMALSGESFAVSPLHAAVSRYLFSDYPNMGNLFSIDNGVHLPTWVAPEKQKLFDSLTNKEWRTHPETLERILELSEDQILAVHEPSRERLGEFLTYYPKVKGNATYDPKRLTLGFSRRFATYKQATMFFDEIDKLRLLGKDIQIVFSGKAHPNDNGGKELIKEVFRYMNDLKGQLSVWFIEDYDMKIAKYLVRGVDLWLNNPRRYEEASGTSGMKAAGNLIPHFSIIDGWSVPQAPAPGYSLTRGLIEGVTGWGIGRAPNEKEFPYLLNGSGSEAKRAEDRKADAKDMSDKLRHIIIPTWKNQREYAKVMRGAAAHNASWFNTHRMAGQYDQVYRRAA